MRYQYTRQDDIIKSFWNNYPQYKKKRGYKQNDYKCDIRCAFVDYVDYLQKSGYISGKLASRVTL